MSGNTPCCRVFQMLLCTAIIISCIVFLAIATFVERRHGPSTDPVEFHLSSFTIQNIQQLPSRKFIIHWNGELQLINQKTSLHVTILRMTPALMHMNQPLSCGLESKARTDIGPQEEKTLGIQHDPEGCEFQHPFLEGKSPNDLADALKRPDFKVQLGVTFYLYYRYKIWGWNVMLSPLCGGLFLKFDDKNGHWIYDKDYGTISTCNIPRPARYI